VAQAKTKVQLGFLSFFSKNPPLASEAEVEGVAKDVEASSATWSKLRASSRS